MEWTAGTWLSLGALLLSLLSSGSILSVGARAYLDFRDRLNKQEGLTRDHAGKLESCSAVREKVIRLELASQHTNERLEAIDESFHDAVVELRNTIERLRSRLND